MPKNSLEKLKEMYADSEASAKSIGLVYVTDMMTGFSRHRRGKGFCYKVDDQPLTSKTQLNRLKALVIPPAWRDVWICPEQNGHILVTGLDEKGRKQYIYHPKWRAERDLLKFYRMIVFAEVLPKIRRAIKKHLKQPDLSREKVIATMLWILDNTYIRIGNDVYYQQNESIGLTTLTDHNVVIAGSVVTFVFKGKSGKEQHFIVEDPTIKTIVTQCKNLRGERLFQYQQPSGQLHPVTATDINQYLKDVTHQPVTAKDFRTWGGTLLAFHHLTDQAKASKKREKVIVEAVDAAANVLGNTRAVARSSYVHPHILNTYGTKNFTSYYQKAIRQAKIPGLDTFESELLHFLELLFKDQFSLLKM